MRALRTVNCIIAYRVTDHRPGVEGPTGHSPHSAEHWRFPRYSSRGFHPPQNARRFFVYTQEIIRFHVSIWAILKTSNKKKRDTLSDGYGRLIDWSSNC